MMPEISEPPAKPSKMLVVAGHTWNLTKILVVITGVLGIAAQVAAQFKPELVSPLQTLKQLLGGLI